MDAHKQTKHRDSRSEISELNQNIGFREKKTGKKKRAAASNRNVKETFKKRHVDKKESPWCSHCLARMPTFT